MERQDFNYQLDRLKSQWPSAYGHERVLRLWLTWKNVSKELFSEIIDEAIDTCRSAPLNEDFSKLELEVKKRKSLDRTSLDLSKMSLDGILSNSDAKYADPEFVEMCRQVRSQLGKIPINEYLSLCNDLDKLSKAYK